MNRMKPCRVLYIEDHDDSGEMLIAIFHAFDPAIRVETVNNSRRAMAQIRAQPYDLYIVDSWLDEMDGAAFCSWLRSTGSEAPVIFYSGAAAIADRETAMRAGAAEYLIKPNDLFRVPEVVADHLAPAGYSAANRPVVNAH